MKKSFLIDWPLSRSLRALCPLALATGLLLAGSAAQAQTTTTFSYTGGNQTYTVPAGVTTLQVAATGASGGLYASSGSPSYAARVQATITVVPGEILTVVVGGTGTNGAGLGGVRAGGFNGGGNGAENGGGGGGATDLRRTSSTGDYLGSRNALLVAGGSGGNSYNGGTSGNAIGGNAGIPTGGTGGTYLTGQAGQGATQTGPGASGGNGATAGSNANGGAASRNPNRGAGAGGGGGGYYGGGGGSGNNDYAGGGGGSSWVMPAGSSAISYSLAATAPADGSLTITAPTSPPSATGGSSCAAGPVTLIASGAPSGGSYRWYTQATGGTVISGATGSSYTTPTLYASTTYYVSIVDGSGTESSRTAARATVFNTLPIRIIAGGPTTFTAPGQSVSLTAQQKNLALQFNGSSQYVSTTLVPSPTNLPTTTWEAWVYPTLNNSSEQDILSSDAGGYSRAIALISGNFVFGNGSNYTTAVAATFNTWQHVAVVYSGGSATFYKNGVSVATAAASFGGSIFTNFNIGRGPTYGNYFQGQLDEARVWNTARSQAQLQAGMSQGLPGTTAGLVGYWRFNEGGGIVAHDETNTYDGTLAGGPTYQNTTQVYNNAGTTYAWTPTTGLNASNTQTVTASPAATTAYTVTVMDPNGCAGPASQTVTVPVVAPTLTSINPTSGATGTSVTLTGSDLTGATAVTFGGTANNTVTTGLTVSGTGSAQTITVTVPSGAQTGNVTVTTPGGTSGGVSFTVTTAPTVTTAAATAITTTSATLGGNVTADGGATITERGVVYVAGTGTPTTSNTKITATGTTGSFTVNATGLMPATQYTVRAYATNSAGTSYGSPVSFTTNASTPVLTAISPGPGARGALITLTGSNLSGATQVAFAGAANNTVTLNLTVSGSGSTQTLAVRLPDGATSGPVTVTTADGTSNALTFTLQVLPVSGFNADVVAEGVGPLAQVTTAEFDLSGARLLELGYTPGGSVPPATVGLPVGGSFTSGTTGLAYQLAPYNGYNSLRLLNTDAGTLALATPAATRLVTVLAASGQAATAMSIQLNFTDGTTQVAASQPVSDWFFGRPYALAGFGRYNGGRLETPTLNPRLYEYPVSVSAANVGKLLASVTLTKTLASGVLNVMGLSLSSTVPTDLVVSTGTAANPTAIAGGVYNSVTVTGTGVASLANSFFAQNNVTVQSGGTLDLSCQVVAGPGSFALAAGGTLGICDAAGLVSSGLVGAVQVNGTRTFSSDASYVYNGTTSQTTGNALPTQVRSLSTTNSTVSLTNALSVAQTLTVAGSGDLYLNGQALTLLSDASGTALVVNSGAGVVNGDVTVQRYLDTPNQGLGYRHYSSPVDGNDLADLTTASFAPVFNSAYNTSATPGTITPFPTVFGYDQARLASATSNFAAFDKGFYSPQATDAMPAGAGFAVNLPGTEKVDFTGSLRTGNYALTLARNAGATAADAGWQLVGNPYPAPLDFSAVAPADRAGLDASMYVFVSMGQYAGQYRSYVNGIGGSPLIGSSQGFFTRVSAGNTSGSLTFRNAQRLTDYATQVAVRRGAADTRPQLTLALAGATGPADALTVYAEAGATAGADAEFDAVKMANPTGLNLASLTAAGQQLAIDGRAGFAAATAVPLFVGVPAAGSYTLAAAELANLAGTRAELVDNLTGTRTLLVAGTRYAFTLAGTTAPGRFWLNLSPAAAPLATSAAALAAQVLAYPNPTHGQLTVVRPAGASAAATLLNSLGQVVRTLALPTAETTLDLTGLATGVYSLRLTINGQPVVKRVVVE